MTSIKTPKEKIHGTPSRLTSRPTAASVARAAHNATRSHGPPQRQSPVRSLPSPVTSKIKTTVLRNEKKSNSKTEIKINRNCEIKIPVVDFDVSTKQEPEVNDNILILDSVSDVVKEKTNEKVEVTNIVDIVTIGAQNAKGIATTSEHDFSVNEQAIAKLPQTPNISRPQTPKSVTSRPQTPRKPSRPSTPSQPLQRQSTPLSRPNTPKANLARPKTPSAPTTTPTPRPVTPVTDIKPPQIAKNDEDLKSLYLSKQKIFLKMKKELDLKQQAVLELFDGIRKLQEEMRRAGMSAGGEGCNDLVVLNVADWAPEEVAQLCRDAIAASKSEDAEEIFSTALPIDECTVAEVESKAKNIPDGFAELCFQACTARQELIDWIKELIDKDEQIKNDGMERIARYNTQGLQLCDALREMKHRSEDAVNSVTLLCKRACKEKSTLLTVGESLVREIAKLRQDLEAPPNPPVITEEVREIKIDPETAKILEQTRRELEEERGAKSIIKEKLTIAESQLRQSKIRIAKMDKQLREAESNIASLTSTVKTLEDQSRQKEVHLEARARKLKESLKTGEAASNNLAHQRDSLQTQVKNLKEQILSLTEQHKSETQTMNDKLRELETALKEERKILETEREKKKKIEDVFNDNQTIIEKLRSRVTHIDVIKPNTDIPSEREMDLWAELQATRDTLRIAEEEMIACKKEKVSFLETLAKIAESENKIGMQQKLAAELLKKEEIVGNMQVQIREFTKNIKIHEQKVALFQEYVRDLQEHIRAIARCEDVPIGDGYQELQEEIMNLKMSLIDAVHRNEELSDNLSQKQQQLEQQDKTSRAQARIIKMREELIDLLNNKESEQSKELVNLQQDLEHRMKIVEEVNKQIAAKADEIQELFATLENKQQQIHRLEKIVFALEEQQRRSQAQRTRHEEKIAALEHELAATNRQERKFLFF